MLVSAVLDPTAFEGKYFNKNYRIQAEDFLRGIQKNGLLILDSENSGKRLGTAFTTRINQFPTNYGQQLVILLEELGKNRKLRVVECPTSPHSPSILDLACNLSTDTEADALIVGDDSLKTLQAAGKHSADVVPLSGYRASTFEKDRQRYEKGFGPIDKLPRATVDELIIRAIRFSKWLRFYDPYIGSGNNTSHFRKGIEYILSLWQKHGFFARQQGIGSVDIFTCSAKRGNRADKRRQHRIVIRDLISPVKSGFPWPVELHVKNDADRIFHARYLQTQHAIIGVDRGFDLFKPETDEFRRNFLTFNMAESSHLRECRNLPDAAL